MRGGVTQASELKNEWGVTQASGLKNERGCYSGLRAKE